MRSSQALTISVFWFVPMEWKGCLLPIALPLSVLLIASWRLTSLEQSPARHQTFSGLPKHQGPDYTKAPPGTYPTCEQNPALADLLLAEGRRLGITVRAGQPELPGKDATYRADPGRLGTITIKQRMMNPVVRCALISHEFIHVLQHLQGNLRGVPTLGWSNTHPDPIPQEAEAYGHQQRAGYVLKLLQETQRP